MKLRKIIYGLCFILMMLIVCGCELELASPESLITPPKSNQEKLQQKQHRQEQQRKQKQRKKLKRLLRNIKMLMARTLHGCQTSTSQHLQICVALV